MMEKMKITPADIADSHRTGTLSNITVEEINRILGFEPNVDDDPDKVVNSWSFEADDGKTCHKLAIWDYKGSHHFKQFSTYGDDRAFLKIFGYRYSRDW